MRSGDEEACQDQPRNVESKVKAERSHKRAGTVPDQNSKLHGEEGDAPVI